MAATRSGRQHFYSGGSIAWDRQDASQRQGAVGETPPTSTPVATAPDDALPFPDTDILYSELARQNAAKRSPAMANPPIATVTSQPAPTAASIPHNTNTQPTVVASGTPIFAPSQVPAGSVYAPVTVNLDTSMFADQLRSMEKRLESVTTSQPATQPPVIQQVIPPQIAQKRNRPAGQRQKQLRQSQQIEHTKELNRIGTGFESLVKSFETLQQQTHANLAEARAQTQSSQQATAEVIEGYRRELALERQRSQLEREMQQREIMRLTQREAALVRERREERIVVAELPEPQLPTVVREAVPRHVPVNQDAKDIPAPKVLFHESGRTQSNRAGMSTRILPPGSGTSPPPLSPQALELKTEPAEKKPPTVQLPEPVMSSRPVSAPAEFTRKLTDNAAKAKVGFANTFKFAMAVDEDKPTAIQHVKKSDHVDKVCPRCGKIHPVSHAHSTSDSIVHASQQQSATRRSASSDVRQTAMQSSASSSPQSAAASSGASQPKRDLRRDTRNAGRGMNRKIGHFAGSGGRDTTNSTAGDHSFLKLRSSTLTQEPDEPGILHRMSSTLRQFGRSVR